MQRFKNILSHAGGPADSDPALNRASEALGDCADESKPPVTP